MSPWWSWQLLGVLLLLEPAASLAPFLGTCKEPPQIPNAFRKSSVGLLIPAGTTIEYSCLRGYELIPGMALGQVVCLQNFTWSPVENFCQKVRCRNPNVTNGVQIPKLRPGEDTYEYGDTVSIECNPGYGIKGGNIHSLALMRCGYDGSWDAAVPVCEPVCEQPRNILHGRHNSWTGKKFFVGSSVMYTCDRGYMVVGEPHIFCQAGDGVHANWSHPPPECTEVQCPAPVIKHGRLKSAQNFTYRSMVTVECDAGYIPMGATTIQCQDSGRWHPREFICVLGRCPSPPAVEHADLHSDWNFVVGSTISYFCKSGYTLLPGVSPEITCLKNFTWSKIPKLCQEIHCPKPVIDHGQETSLVQGAYTVGRSAEFRCDPGYVLQGARRIQCSSGGTWQPPVPYCDRVCGPPPKIKSGQYSSLRMLHFPYGSKVTYRCAEGLSLVGESSIYCTSLDGKNVTWSGPAPECKVVRCPKPVIAHGGMSPPRHTFPYGEAVGFSCDQGYVLHGSNKSQCGGDSTWHPPLPTCQPEIDDIKAGFECGVPIAELKMLLEIQKLFLEIQKLKLSMNE
ncbi:C4b-binding protein alpha chain-like [Eudromia elegans]